MAETLPPPRTTRLRLMTPYVGELIVDPDAIVAVRRTRTKKTKEQRTIVYFGGPLNEKCARVTVESNKDNDMKLRGAGW